MKRLRLGAGVRTDLREAALFYDGRQPGLGDDCIAEANEAFRLIRERPGAGNIVKEDVRHYRLRRFPYYVVFINRADHIFVVAFTHQRRHSDHWMSRL